MSKLKIIFIDSKQSLFHKKPSLSQVLENVFDQKNLKEKINEYQKNKKFDSFLDLLNNYALENNFESIPEKKLNEIIQGMTLKLKTLDTFFLNFENKNELHFFFICDSDLRRSFFEYLISLFYTGLLPKITFYRSIHDLQIFYMKKQENNENHSFVLVSHNLAYFKDFDKNFIKIYFCNNFYNNEKKQMIENFIFNKKNEFYPDHEINTLLQLKSALLFLENSLVKSEKIIYVGYLIFGKKTEEFSAKEILLSDFPLKMLPIDTRYEILPRNFNIVFHKITDVLKYFPDKNTSDAYNQIFENFYNTYKNTIYFIDPLDHLKVVYSRVSFQKFFEQIFENVNFISDLKLINKDVEVKVPKIITINSETHFKTISEKVFNDKLNPPFIVKPVQALGEAKTHFMAVALNLEGLEKVEQNEIFKSTPHIIQEFVNHDETIFKIYVAAGKTIFNKRQSLPNITLEILGDDHFFFDSQISFVDQLSYLKNRAKNFERKEVEIEMELIQNISNEISCKSGFSFYGYDIIKKTGGEELYVVDINYLPGFKSKGSLKEEFHGHFLKLMGKNK